MAEFAQNLALERKSAPTRRPRRGVKSFERPARMNPPWVGRSTSPPRALFRMRGVRSKRTAEGDGCTQLLSQLVSRVKNIQRNLFDKPDLSVLPRPRAGRDITSGTRSWLCLRCVPAIHVDIPILNWGEFNGCPNGHPVSLQIVLRIVLKHLNRLMNSSIPTLKGSPCDSHSRLWPHPGKPPEVSTSGPC